MFRFTPESQDALLRAWDHGHFDHEQVEEVFQFMTDLEHGRVDRYRHVQLQTSSDRWLYYLPSPGLVALVDLYPTQDGCLLDLVSVYHDGELADTDPWGLP